MQKYYFNSNLFGIATLTDNTSPGFIAKLLLFFHT